MAIEIRDCRLQSIAAGLRPRPWLAVFLLAAVGASAEGGYLSSTVEANALNLNPPPYNSFTEETLGLATKSDDSALSFNQSYSFNGHLNAYPDTMGYSVSANAQSDYGVLRASYNSSITNAFSDPDNPAYNPTTKSGVPDGFNGQSDASFSDRLNVSGGADLASIRLIVQMDGRLSQAGSAYPYSAGYAALWQSYVDPTYGYTYDAIIPGARVDTSPGGSFGESIVTDTFAVTSGHADVYLLLQAYASWEINSPQGQLLANGSSVSSTIDFFDTAKVVGVEGFDANGNGVALTSVIGASGTVYPTVASVPEPGSVVLIALGAVTAALGLRAWPGALGHPRRRTT